jgi:DNA-binding transcriptional LysR family regulator
MTLELVPLADDAAEKLRRGENDFLIIPRHFLDPEHPQRTLFEDHYSAVIWDGNTQVGDTIDAATYERLSHVAPMLGRPRSATMEELMLQAQGVKRRIRVTTFDFSTMATALVGTELVATMHTRLALACARRLPIRVLPLPYTLPVLAECLQWHGFQENDPCHIWLRGVMLEIARGLPAHHALPAATLSANAIETGRAVAGIAVA